MPSKQYKATTKKGAMPSDIVEVKAMLTSATTADVWFQENTPQRASVATIHALEVEQFSTDRPDSSTSFTLIV